MRRLAMALAAVIVMLVAVIVSTAVWVVHQQDVDRARAEHRTCESINEGRAGSRTAIGVLRDLVTATSAGSAGAPLTAQPGAEPAVVQLVADLNRLIGAGRTAGATFRKDANAAIDKALHNLQPARC